MQIVIIVIKITSYPKFTRDMTLLPLHLPFILFQQFIHLPLLQTSNLLQAPLNRYFLKPTQIPIHSLKRLLKSLIDRQQLFLKFLVIQRVEVNTGGVDYLRGYL